MASHSRRRRREDFQIAVICALPLEYDAVVFACDEIWEEDRVELRNASGDGNTYKTGRIGSHGVVLLLLPGMGKLAILCGICGGVPGVKTSNEVFLGDVVISKSIVQYDLGRKYPNRFAPKDTVEDTLGRPSQGVRSLVATFQTLHDRSDLQRRASQVLEQIQQRAADKGHQNLYRRPGEADRLFEPDYVHRHRDSPSCGCSESEACEDALTTSCEMLQCDPSRIIPRMRPMAQAFEKQTLDDTVTQEVRVLVGRLGSGDTVLKAGLDRDRIAREHDLLAFEMEGAGIWDVVPSVVVKAFLFRITKIRTSLGDLKPSIGSNGSLGTRSIKQASLQYRTRELRSMGLGVSGAIALTYAFWLHHSHPNVSVFWVHASNAGRFRQAYSSIAQECDIPGYDDPKADVLMLVKTWLEKGSRGRWLMVIDNADDTHLFFSPHSPAGSNKTNPTTETQVGLGRYVPECGHGSIIITSRNKQTASRLVRGKSLLEVGAMSERETGQLLHTMLDDEFSTEEASVLSAQLEHLPLAIAQAAAFIRENGISIAKYLRLLEESDEHLVEQLSEPFETVGRDSETPHALTATWIFLFNQIQRQDALASDVLSFACLLDRQGIPEEFIISFCNQRNTEGHQITTSSITKALGTLKAFSLVSGATDDTIHMHRMNNLASTYSHQGQHKEAEKLRQQHTQTKAGRRRQKS
ncbi:hypothetical protein CSHISOI_05627 [Colletotrichum shisoi]|uniref:Nucleoside phosphorylase domain-containing protein n=1 Tax=Colletotrichum shisoi TaxID=2078593 RepID=A0A5Q4BSH8_9PEZI|nr:hypothetical protein CSHISOI_05627 [Colletotrichum shisoi]